MEHLSRLNVLLDGLKQLHGENFSINHPIGSNRVEKTVLAMNKITSTNKIGVHQDTKKKSARKSGGSISHCVHNRRKQYCPQCGGSSICSHGRRRNECKDCGGSRICPHSRRKTECKECGGVNICFHGKHKRYCIDCDGSRICPHGRQKAFCKQCGGSAICCHKKVKYSCKSCTTAQLATALPVCEAKAWIIKYLISQLYEQIFFALIWYSSCFKDYRAISYSDTTFGYLLFMVICYIHI